MWYPMCIPTVDRPKDKPTYLKFDGTMVDMLLGIDPS